MARHGITYNDVAKAAMLLMKLDKNVTTDGIREVLGTGSKTTITKHLKEWKIVHSDILGFKSNEIVMHRIYSIQNTAIDLDQIVDIHFNKKTMIVRFKSMHETSYTKVSENDFNEIIKAWTIYVNMMERT
jgi:hypothetical protein